MPGENSGSRRNERPGYNTPPAPTPKPGVNGYWDKRTGQFHYLSPETGAPEQSPFTGLGELAQGFGQQYQRTSHARGPQWLPSEVRGVLGGMVGGATAIGNLASGLGQTVANIPNDVTSLANQVSGGRIPVVPRIQQKNDTPFNYGVQNRQAGLGDIGLDALSRFGVRGAGSAIKGAVAREGAKAAEAVRDAATGVRGRSAVRQAQQAAREGTTITTLGKAASAEAEKFIAGGKQDIVDTQRLIDKLGKDTEPGVQTPSDKASPFGQGKGSGTGGSRGSGSGRGSGKGSGEGPAAFSDDMTPEQFADAMKQNGVSGFDLSDEKFQKEIEDLNREFGYDGNPRPASPPERDFTRPGPERKDNLKPITGGGGTTTLEREEATTLKSDVEPKPDSGMNKPEAPAAPAKPSLNSTSSLKNGLRGGPQFVTPPTPAPQPQAQAQTVKTPTTTAVGVAVAGGGGKPGGGASPFGAVGDEGLIKRVF